MSINASRKTGNVDLSVYAYVNCDDVELCWRAAVGGQIDQAIPEVLGYMLERQRKGQGGAWGAVEVLRNRVGFTEDPSTGTEESSGAPSRPSSVWPFQCFDWTDHGANSGQTVRYRVSAVRLPAGGILGTTPMQPVADTGWTGPIEVTARADHGVAAYFNRGAVMSQYVARVARMNSWGPRDIKQHIKELQEPLRRFLSGELRLALLKLLDDVIDDPALDFYAALYELSDDELIGRLKLLRGRAHVILANGSDKAGDGNQAARTELENAQVDVHDRLLGNKGLGHNKFAVVVRRQGRVPQRAWTGSTNWAATGLCTQLNNGIRFETNALARVFLDQWDRLAAAHSNFPATLVQANAQSPRTVGSVDVWFTRVRNKSTTNVGLGADLQALVDLVNGAKEAILYVMFQPGPEPLTSILRQAATRYVRGVVSEVTTTNREHFKLSGIGGKHYQTALVQPEGIGKDFAWWVKEVTRAQFLFPSQNPGVGHAITHAKMIVIDPHLPDCKVVTGSHNFSGSASEQNDDNFVVVRGDRSLAEAYSVACLGTYRHYRWRAYVKDMMDQGKNPWDHLEGAAAWQGKYLTPARRAHLDMWCR
jgi:phospholipase D-like protein